MLYFPLLYPGNNSDMVISNFGIKWPDCVLPIVAPSFHVSFEELEIAGCIHCFIFSEQLTHAPDVHCKQPHHVMFSSIRNYDWKRFLRSTPFFCLGSLRLVLPFLFYSDRMVDLSSAPGIHHIHLTWNQFTKGSFLVSFRIFNIWVVIRAARKMSVSADRAFKPQTQSLWKASSIAAVNSYPSKSNIWSPFRLSFRAWNICITYVLCFCINAFLSNIFPNLRKQVLGHWVWFL